VVEAAGSVVGSEEARLKTSMLLSR